MFDTITATKASTITDFFPDRNLYFANAERTFIKEMFAWYDRLGDVYSENIQSIINTWEMEQKALEDSTDELNNDLINTFRELMDRIIDCQNFDSFLDDISTIGYSNSVAVYSKYSDLKKHCLTADDLYDTVGNYIQELVMRGELILKGFRLWDDFFCATLDEKYGVPYDEEDE